MVIMVKLGENRGKAIISIRISHVLYFALYILLWRLSPFSPNLDFFKKVISPIWWMGRIVLSVFKFGRNCNSILYSKENLYFSIRHSLDSVHLLKAHSSKENLYFSIRYRAFLATNWKITISLEILGFSILMENARSHILFFWLKGNSFP